MPFVDKSVYLAGFFIAFYIGVNIVRKADKAYAPFDKISVYVTLNQLHIPCKARLMLA